MTPRQQEIAIKLMEIYEECHRDCEASRLEATEERGGLIPARCTVCDLISQYYAIEYSEPDKERC
jgi:hypothetical protein